MLFKCIQTSFNLGANAAASRHNLQTFVGLLVNHACKRSVSVAQGGDGHPLHGVYEELSCSDVSKIVQILLSSQAMHDWYSECVTGGLSCGNIYIVTGSQNKMHCTKRCIGGFM